MGAIIGGILAGIISMIGELISGMAGAAVGCTKSTIASILTLLPGTILGGIGTASWVNIGAYGSYILGALGTGLGGVATAIGGILGGGGIITGIIGTISGIGGGVVNFMLNVWTMIEPMIGSAMAALIGLIPVI